MSGDRYKIADQEQTYFLTLTVIDWVDVFTRKDYKLIIVDSLNYCVASKGLEIFAWVIMSNHIHLMVRAREGFMLSHILRDFKKFTSTNNITMVVSRKITNKYIALLELVKNEAEKNPSIWEYFKYLNDYKEKFISDSNILFKEDLKEFLRGANRYSDEFVFSDKYYSLIRITTNEIYDILNNENIT
jgi:REP element-mobilizing transposase RayT